MPQSCTVKTEVYVKEWRLLVIECIHVIDPKLVQNGVCDQPRYGAINKIGKFCDTGEHVYRSTICVNLSIEKSHFNSKSFFGGAFSVVY